MIADKKFMIYKVVSCADLEQATRDGWGFVETLNIDKPTAISHQSLATPGSNNLGIYALPTVTVESPFVIREPMFLLRKHPEQESREQTLKLDLDRAKEGGVQALEALRKMQNERDTYKQEADLRTEQVNKCLDVQRKMAESKCKLEADMAKVRQAIGDIKYFDIVGGPIPAK